MLQPAIAALNFLKPVAVLVVLLPALLACEAPAESSAKPAPEASAQPAPAQGSASATSAAKLLPPRFIRGPTGGTSVEPFIKLQLDAASRSRASASGYTQVVVYVGATWCEPCQRFHQAVTAGQLDEQLRGVSFVEFDLDQDHDALSSAGYASALIPLFALPEASGRGGARRIFGSISGPGATANIAPRLQRLLAGEPAD